MQETDYTESPATKTEYSLRDRKHVFLTYSRCDCPRELLLEKI